MKTSNDRFTPDTITAADLRAILFYIDNQALTVKDLRDKLFQVEDQDKELPIDFALWAKLGINK